MPQRSSCAGVCRVCFFLILFLSSLKPFLSFSISLHSCFYGAKLCEHIWFSQSRTGKADATTKLPKLLYLLDKTLPLLKHIQQEQSSELDVEARTRGIVI